MYYLFQKGKESLIKEQQDLWVPLIITWIYESTELEPNTSDSTLYDIVGNKIKYWYQAGTWWVTDIIAALDLKWFTLEIWLEETLPESLEWQYYDSFLKS